MEEVLVDTNKSVEESAKENDDLVVPELEDDSNIYAKLEASEKTSLTDFFRLNNEDPEANQHLYHELCRFYVWDKNKKRWYTRKQTMTQRNDDDEDPEGDGPTPLSEQIGRIPMVSLHPKCRE